MMAKKEQTIPKKGGTFGRKGHWHLIQRSSSQQKL